MNKQTQWVKNQVRLGWLLLIAGAVIFVIGLLLPVIIEAPGFNTRIVGGIGILLMGIGVANVVRFSSASHDPQAARRVVSAERDERLRAIRARAGSRAYLASAVLIYVLLMWLSFAANGSLPQLSNDILWYCLAAALVLPFLVYAYTLIDEQRKG